MNKLMKPELADRYPDFEKWHWWFKGRQRILESVLRHTLLNRDSPTILSLGCGPSEGLNWVRDVVGPNGRVVGLDADPRYAPTVDSTVQFVLGLVENVPMSSRSCDVVLLLDLLEHLDDDTAGLKEAVRVLKPGGTLLFTVPAMPILWGQQDEVSNHRRRYTRKSLRALFLKAGLPFPYVTYFNTVFLLPIMLVRCTRRIVSGPQDAHSDFEDNRPGLLNDVLAEVFAAERHVVTRVSLPAGVSLLGILKT